MNVEQVPLSELHLDPANVRTHPDRNRAAIRASLARFGLQKPVVIDANNVVRAGNGTVEAARELGWESIACVRTPLSGSEATAYSVADNRTSELAAWDDEALAATLNALRDEDFDLEAVGFTDEEVDRLCGVSGGLPQTDGEDGEETGDEWAAEPLVYANDAIIDEAFRWFRKTGFPYRNLPVHVSMQEINRLAASEDSSRVDTGYQIADTYHPHRFGASVEGMTSPVAAFNDDSLLRRCLRLVVDEGGNLETRIVSKITIVSGTQACSNFRPGFACKLYREYCQPGATVLDTSTGYGGRLVGFIASGMAGKYVGIDPNVLTHEGNLRMAADLRFSDRVELVNLPAEDVPHERVAGLCDFAFTSPPYFRKEHYSDDVTQSWKRYETGDAWRDGFLGPMMALQFAALKPGSYAVVNVADVKIGGRMYPLAAWTAAAGRAAGFDHVRTDEFPMQKRFGAGHDDEVATEPVLVFRKPAQTVNGSRGRESSASNRSTR